MSYTNHIGRKCWDVRQSGGEQQIRHIYIYIYIRYTKWPFKWTHNERLVVLSWSRWKAMVDHVYNKQVVVEYTDVLPSKLLLPRIHSECGVAVWCKKSFLKYIEVNPMHNFITWVCDSLWSRYPSYDQLSSLPIRNYHIIPNERARHTGRD